MEVMETKKRHAKLMDGGNTRKVSVKTNGEVALIYHDKVRAIPFWALLWQKNVWICDGKGKIYGNSDLESLDFAYTQDGLFLQIGGEKFAINAKDLPSAEENFMFAFALPGVAEVVAVSPKYGNEIIMITETDEKIEIIRQLAKVFLAAAGVTLEDAKKNKENLSDVQEDNEDE